MTLSEIFARNLAALRQLASLSQEELARKAHLSVSYISMLERNKRTPPLETLERLAKVLGATPLYMLQQNQHPPAARRPRR